MVVVKRVNATIAYVVHFLRCNCGVHRGSFNSYTLNTEESSGVLSLFSFQKKTKTEETDQENKLRSRELTEVRLL